MALELYGILYGKAQPDDASAIVQSLLAQGKPVEHLLYREPVTGNPVPYYRQIPFYQKQQRTVLRRRGICVQTCEDLHGMSYLYFVERGYGTKIAFFGDESKCVSCLECVARCPVGVLISRNT